MSTSLQSAQTAPPSNPTSFQTAQMPIEGPVSDIEEAVQKLKQCPLAELKQARRHHRRALEALHMGGYRALSGDTRQQLTERLRTDLEALNKALEEVEREEGTLYGSECPNDSGEPTDGVASSLLQEVLPWNW